MQTFNFNSGISVLISEMRLKEEVTITRHQHSNLQNFILLFHEQFEKTDKNRINKSFPASSCFLQEIIVRLSSSLSSTESKSCRFKKDTQCNNHF